MADIMSKFWVKKGKAFQILNLRNVSMFDRMFCLVDSSWDGRENSRKFPLYCFKFTFFSGSL